MSAPRAATVLRLAAIVFVTAWAVRSLIVTGDAVLNEHYKTALLTSPWVTQATSGNGFEQSLIQIRSEFPENRRVLVIWPNAPDYYYAYFWSTFWLFPRSVNVDVTSAALIAPDADALVVVQPANATPPGFPGFQMTAVRHYPDYVITTYTRSA